MLVAMVADKFGRIAAVDGSSEGVSESVNAAGDSGAEKEEDDDIDSSDSKVVCLRRRPRCGSIVGRRTMKLLAASSL